MSEYVYQQLNPKKEPAFDPERCAAAVAMPRGLWRQCFSKDAVGRDADGRRWCVAHLTLGLANGDSNGQ